MSVHDFFTADGVDLEGLSAYLDRLGSTERIAAVRTVKPKEQAALWPAVEGRNLDLNFFVPADTEPLQTVIHYGYNNQIPGFRVFEKRFCRPTEGADAGDKLWGYNQFFLKGLTGPGYFVARPNDIGSVVIDYYQVPTEKPADWPEIQANEGLVSGLVYGKMHDHMRGVSKHVSIGRATKNGKETGNYFMLCREAHSA